MEKEEITKRFNSAGKSLKQAGIAFLTIPIVGLIVGIISTQADMIADNINAIIIISSVLYLISFIIVALKLIWAGDDLMEIPFNKKEEENEIMQMEKTETTKKTIRESGTFNSENHPNLIVEINRILNSALIDEHSASIIISFCKDHTLTEELIDKNKVFAQDVAKGEIKTTEIQSVFQSQKDDEEFIKSFEKFLESNLKK